MIVRWEYIIHDTETNKVNENEASSIKNFLYDELSVCVGIQHFCTDQ